MSAPLLHIATSAQWRIATDDLRRAVGLGIAGFKSRLI